MPRGWLWRMPLSPAIRHCLNGRICASLPATESATWLSIHEFSLEAAQKGRPMPPTPYYPELADTVAAALQEILSTQADITTTLQKFENV